MNNNFAELPFEQAGSAWLETRKPYISERTVRDYTIYIRTLNKYFGMLRLPEITADLIRA